MPIRWPNQEKFPDYLLKRKIAVLWAKGKGNYCPLKNKLNTTDLSFIKSFQHISIKSVNWWKGSIKWTLTFESTASFNLEPNFILKFAFREINLLNSLTLKGDCSNIWQLTYKVFKIQAVDRVLLKKCKSEGRGIK
jgi:hypothetical protein